MENGKETKDHHNPVTVVDGRDIVELVKNEAAFSSYVDHKFKELDRDGDGKLSVKELEPAIVDIGAAIGLPAKGSSPESDHIYYEVQNEFTHGRRRPVRKKKFKKVLSDILLGMAAGLQRDPVVILRVDGEDLKEFTDGSAFESEAIAIYLEIFQENASLRKMIMLALEHLGIDHGMPPASDTLVYDSIVEPAARHLSLEDQEGDISQEVFMRELKIVLGNIYAGLQEHPIIVAHSENHFDGSGVGRLLSNAVELEKLLDMAWEELPKKKVNQKASKEYLRVALDGIACSAGLPPYGAITQLDAVVNEALRIVNADDGKKMREEEFKRLMREILGTIRLKLEMDPISVSANSVVHESLTSSSTLLPVHVPGGENLSL